VILKERERKRERESRSALSLLDETFLGGLQDLAQGGDHVESHEFPHDGPPAPLVSLLQERRDFLDDAHLLVDSFVFFSFFLFIAGSIVFASLCARRETRSEASVTVCCR